ncbi:RNA polymerase sigma factor [Cohnella terricola]|uniref:RNA polymerase sigma factor n=1 Tax=Cohnella terricola TaxID=1289167 RepID=A0A559JWP3_9BACL|nr:RNA polymerase sigma factor [Cohnella terricola]TVY04311.1 RNA polymerase sigma factor [Cohnella terricola]
MEVIPTYEKLITPYMDDLRRYCFYLTKSKWDGEDLLQDTLLKSLVFFSHTEPLLDMKPFLMRVARNLWIDEHRKKQRRLAVLVEPPKLYHNDNDYIEVRSAIEWLAERFPRRSIEIWLLFRYFGYSMQEIADSTNSTVSAVKSIIFRTRNVVRSRHKPAESSKVLHFDVERWSRAIMNDMPQSLLS